MSQSDMNICAHEAWQHADVDLNDTYARAMEVARGWSDGAAEALRAAQRAWIPYRDAACTAEGFLFEGGSMEPFIVNSCLEHLTRQRTEEMRAVYEMN
ncbi:lysozyme inhibitor LprI family protein [Celeribacter halophilus]|uniref:lysozyme inhibitor LprI family protein n=1 Tax=Celeribacter halophilus TaxID=576117 RepID=UPI003A90DABD